MYVNNQTPTSQGFQTYRRIQTCLNLCSTLLRDNETQISRIASCALPSKLYCPWDKIYHWESIIYPAIDKSPWVYWVGILMHGPHEAGPLERTKHHNGNLGTMVAMLVPFTRSVSWDNQTVIPGDRWGNFSRLPRTSLVVTSWEGMHLSSPPLTMI